MQSVIYPTKEMLDSFLKTVLTESSWSMKQRGYVAPTIYLEKGFSISGWNYYATLDDAFNKLKYIVNEGGYDARPAGSVTFKPDSTAQPAGINVDFYLPVNKDSIVNLGYKAMKFLYENYTQPSLSVCRFFKTDGSGPYFLVLNKEYFGIAATKVDSYSADKIAALDTFHREAALLKARHNVLAIFLNELAARQLTPFEQQIFNDGSLRLQTMRTEMASIEGLNPYYSKDGQVGFLGIPLIAWIIVAAIVASWAASKILTEAEKTKRLNLSYNQSKWAEDQRLKISQEITKGTISKEQGDSLYKSLTGVSIAAAKNAETASASSPSMFGEIGDIVKWGAIGLGVYAVANAVGRSK